MESLGDQYGGAVDLSGNSKKALVKPYPEEIKPGVVITGRPGDKPHILANPRPAQSFDAFYTRILHALTASTGQPYVSVTKDFSQTNYSSARAALLEVWKLYTLYQDWFVRGYLNRVYAMKQKAAETVTDLAAEAVSLATDKPSLRSRLTPRMSLTGEMTCGGLYAIFVKHLAAATIAFVAAGNTITDTGNGFVAAAFAAGQTLIVEGSANNNGQYRIKAVEAGTLTLDSAVKAVVDEAAGVEVTLHGGTL